MADPRTVFIVIVGIVAIVSQVAVLFSVFPVLKAQKKSREEFCCRTPPPGWYCTRTPGHEGPCAAWPEENL